MVPCICDGSRLARVIISVMEYSTWMHGLSSHVLQRPILTYPTILARLTVVSSICCHKWMWGHGWTLLDDILVSVMATAVTTIKGDDGTVFVGQQLHLRMAGVGRWRASW